VPDATSLDGVWLLVRPAGLRPLGEVGEVAEDVRDIEHAQRRSHMRCPY
jgi:hypothetical protein